MRWFTWMAALCPLGPPDIPQATPLPVPETTLSQCSPRHFHSPPVQGLRRTSQSGACASSVVSRPPPHNPVTTPRTIFPDLTTRRGELTKRYTNQVQTSTSHTQWSANKYTSLSHQKPSCKYSSNGIPERSSTAAMYQRRWGEQLTPAELLARFLADYPHAWDDAAITGSWISGLLACRPAAFAPAEEAELGTCAKRYEEAHKFFSPGTFTICCAVAHPKMLGSVVMDKRERTPALLNALLSHYALLPHFVVYDFACGALRSAIGKLPFLVRFLVFISDMFHIVNHLCSDALHPRSYVSMDKANTVAHEQRNAPINPAAANAAGGRAGREHGRPQDEECHLQYHGPRKEHLPVPSARPLQLPSELLLPGAVPLWLRLPP